LRVTDWGAGALNRNVWYRQTGPKQAKIASAQDDFPEKLSNTSNFKENRYLAARRNQLHTENGFYHQRFDHSPLKWRSVFPNNRPAGKVQ